MKGSVHLAPLHARHQQVPVHALVRDGPVAARQDVLVKLDQQ